jgi:hypothetical protein
VVGVGAIGEEHISKVAPIRVLIEDKIRRGLLRELLREEIVTHFTSDAVERYLTVDVSGD